MKEHKKHFSVREALKPNLCFPAVEKNITLVCIKPNCEQKEKNIFKEMFY